MKRTRLQLQSLYGFSRRAQALPGLIAYLPLTDVSGASAAEIARGNNWTYIGGPTLNQLPGPGDQQGWPLFDGATQSVQASAGALAALNTAGVFNPQEFSVVIWGQISNVAIWNDASIRHMIIIGVDLNNRFNIRKSAANTFGCVCQVGGVVQFTRDQAGVNTILPFVVAVSASTAQNLAKVYLNGVQIGANSAFSGAGWVGALTANFTEIGAASGLTNPWSGWIGRCALYNRALSTAELLSLSSMP